MPESLRRWTAECINNNSNKNNLNKKIWKSHTTRKSHLYEWDIISMWIYKIALNTIKTDYIRLPDKPNGMENEKKKEKHQIILTNTWWLCNSFILFGRKAKSHLNNISAGWLSVSVRRKLLGHYFFFVCWLLAAGWFNSRSSIWEWGRLNL